MISVNTFSGGMNSDTAYSRMAADTYTYAENIRVRAKKAVGGDVTAASLSDYIVTGVPMPIQCSLSDGDAPAAEVDILATAALDDIVVMLSLLEGKKIQLFRLTIDKSTDSYSSALIFETTDLDSIDTSHAISMLLYRETAVDYTLYIADGTHPIAKINLREEFDDYYLERSYRQLTSGVLFPSSQMHILAVTQGALPCGQCQWIYRLYKKRCSFSRLSPPTPKIQIINSSKMNEKGCKQGTLTDIGIKLSIPYDEELFTVYDSMQVYRLDYLESGASPTVTLVRDELISSEEADREFTDNGWTSLQTLSIDELLAMNTESIVPSILAQTSGRLFVAKVVDKAKFHVTSSEWDARAFSFNADGVCRLYNDDYSDYKDYTEVQTPDDGYYLNICADINYDKEIADAEAALSSSSSARGNTLSTDSSDADKVSTTASTVVAEDDDSVTKTSAYSTVYRQPSGEYSQLTDYQSTIGTISTDIYDASDDLIDRFYDTEGDDGDTTSEGETEEVEEDEDTMFFFDTDGLYGGEGPNVSYRIVSAAAVIHSSCFSKSTSTYGWVVTDAPPSVSDDYDRMLYFITTSYLYTPVSGTTWGGDETIGAYFSSRGVTAPDDRSYGNILFSSMLRSLRYGETYRYAIILYDEDGASTDALWIADIKTPFAGSLHPFSGGGTSLATKHETAYPLGVMFKVTLPDGNIITDSLGNKHTIVGYEIVRCEKDTSSSRVLMEGVLSRPIRQATVNGAADVSLYTPYYPSGLLTSQKMFISPRLVYDTDYVTEGSNANTDLTVWDSKSTDNESLFQFFSPEVIFDTDAALEKVSSATTLVPERFLFNESTAEYTGLTFARADYWTEDLSTSYAMDITYTPLKVKQEMDSGYTAAVYNILHYKKANFDARDVLSQSLEGASEVKYYTSCLYSLDQKASESFNFYPYRCDAAPAIYFVKFKNSAVYEGTEDYSTTLYSSYALFARPTIKGIRAAKNPSWDEGFTSETLEEVSSGNYPTGIKNYKSFVTDCLGTSFCNWCCGGKYDLRLNSYSDSTYGCDNGTTKEFTYAQSNGKKRDNHSLGYIGPGGPCLLLSVDDEEEYDADGMYIDWQKLNLSVGRENISYDVDGQVLHAPLGTLLVDLVHTATQFSGVSLTDMSLDTYYSFGSYYKVDSSETESHLTVFDGDIYIDIFEIPTMFKAYDFNSVYDTLLSAQMLNFVPLQSPLNPNFDYGRNYRQTESANLLLSAGYIPSVCSQDRAYCLYNPVLFDNNTSAFSFSAQARDIEADDEATVNFPHRCYYSEKKTNGEAIDSWLVFKAASFFDVNSAYGVLTAIYGGRDCLYFWQRNAFGKMPVNERALISSSLGSTITLGTSGILDRCDYISTDYGLYPDHFKTILPYNGGFFWIDDDHYAIVCFDTKSVINVTVKEGVASLFRSSQFCSSDTPDITDYIGFDADNKEVLVKFRSGLLALSMLTERAVSVRTNIPEELFNVEGTLYSWEASGLYRQNCFLSTDDMDYYPVVLSFALSDSPRRLKVFDNQEFIFEDNTEDEDALRDHLLSNYTASYTTDQAQSSLTSDLLADTLSLWGGNIRFPIPRAQYQASYGGRLRGKWLLTTLKIGSTAGYALSGAVTRYRASDYLFVQQQKQ